MSLLSSEIGVVGCDWPDRTWQMPDPRSSAIQRALAAELRRLRELTGMSGDEVARELTWSPSKVSRIETNKTGVKAADLSRMLDLYDVDDLRRSQLEALASEPEHRGWWSAYLDAIPADYATYISLEDSASELACWSPEIVHGLLQTEQYAQAGMDMLSEITRPTPRAMQRRVEVRMRRQDLLTSPESKPVAFILDESALLHRFGTAEVMGAQLARLAEVSRYPNVTLRVLPFAGPHPVTPGGFALLKFAPLHGTAFSDLVYIEQLMRSLLIEDEAEVHEYQMAFQRLTDAALDEKESRRLIDVAARRWS